MDVVFVFLPVTLTAIAAWMFWLALRAAQRIAWGWGIGGVGILVLVSAWFAFVASWGGLGAPAAFFEAAVTTMIAAISGVILAVTLPGWRKLVLGLLAVLFPLSLFVSIEVSDTKIPRQYTRAAKCLGVAVYRERG